MAKVFVTVSVNFSQLDATLAQVLAMGLRLCESVCLSVTWRYRIETA